MTKTLSTQADSFMSIETFHFGSVQWFWTDSYLHNTDYHIQVNDSMYRKAAALASKYGIYENTSFCCQGEGLEFKGHDLEKVTVATRELAIHLARFNGVCPLMPD